MSATVTLTAAEVMSVLRTSRKAAESLAMLREVTMDDPEAAARQLAYYDARRSGGDAASVGYDPKQPTFRRIDALMIGKRLATGERLRTAIEVKVTRADFRRDTDEKRRPWREHTHQFVYLVPEGLVTKDEVPPGCGLWYITQPWTSEVDGVTRGAISSIVRAQVNREPKPLWSDQFATYMAGRASRAEAQLVGATTQCQRFETAYYRELARAENLKRQLDGKPESVEPPNEWSTT